MNFGIIIVVIIAGLWALGAILGVIGGSKAFTHTPASLDSSDVQSQEQKTIDDTEAKRQKLMDDMQRKMDDGYKQY